MKVERNEKIDYSPEFMLKEYERIHDLWMDENKQSEQRVNFFMTVATAATGAIILIFQFTTLPKQIISFAANGVLIILLLLGITIINRLNSRIIQIRAFRRSLIEIQNYFAERDAEIANYLAVQRKIFEGQKHQSKLTDFIHNAFSGTLSDLMTLSNGLICGGITLITLSNAGFTVRATVIGTLVAIIVSIRIIRIYSKVIRKKLQPWGYY